MKMRALGVYRETEFSPGKVDADAAILDAALAELSALSVQVSAVSGTEFAASGAGRGVDLVLAMCQGAEALAQLAACERRGAIAVNSALAIRNCYRDLLGPGLARAGAPIPAGVLVSSAPPLDHRALAGLDLSGTMFVKRGDLHALNADDVQRVKGRARLETALAALSARGVPMAYVQQEAVGRVVKFYGVSGGGFFAALPERGELSGALEHDLADAASNAAGALGLEVWGGDAMVDGDILRIIDFNDWPSCGPVRDQAARAIARRCMQLTRLAAARTGT